MNTTTGRCPPDDDLCALFDGESGRRIARLRQHVAGCVHCEGKLLAFAQVRSQLQPLQRLPDGAGIAEAVLLRLPRRPARRRFALAWPGGGRLTQAGTRVLGAAAALAAGSALGLFLVAGGAIADRTGMSVFSAEPGRQLCLGLPSCGR